MAKVEGDAASRIVQLLRGGKTMPTTFTNAVVTQLSPLAVRIFGEDADTPEEALIIPEHLTDRVIEMRPVGSIDYVEYEIKSPLIVNDTVTVVLADDGQLVYVIGKEMR